MHEVIRELLARPEPKFNERELFALTEHVGAAYELTKLEELDARRIVLLVSGMHLPGDSARCTVTSMLWRRAAEALCMDAGNARSDQLYALANLTLPELIDAPETFAALVAKADT